MKKGIRLRLGKEIWFKIKMKIGKGKIRGDISIF